MARRKSAAAASADVATEPRSAARAATKTAVGQLANVAAVQPRVDHEITVWCEARGRERWFARLWDRRTSQHCGGAGDTALEAIAWCMDAYVRQALLGRSAQIACHPLARPGEGLQEVA